MSDQQLPSVECQHCGGKNNLFADKCWICFYPLVDAPVYIEHQPPKTMTVSRILGIVFGTILLICAFLAAAVIVLFLVCVAFLRANM